VVTAVTALIAALAAVLAAACAAADGALLSLDPEEPLEHPIAALRDRRERIHRALAFARVVGQLGAGIAVAMLLARSNFTSLGVAAGAIASALLLVSVSESVARSVGDTRAFAVLDRLRGPILVLERILAPVVTLGEVLDRGLHSLLPPREADQQDREAMAEQFKQVVAAEAEVSADEQVLLNGVFRLAQAEVHEIMVPRIDMVAIDESAPWQEVVDRVRASEHSRLPVYAESIDNVVGVLYAKDLLPAVLADTPPAGGWTSLVRPAVFIPRAKPADRQLRDFQSTRTHLAVVVDEFGGTAGIITIEDVLEEIVGDIRDEYDVEEAPVEHLDHQRLRVSARLTLNELSELLRHDFERDDISTVGGLVYEQFGRAPKAGESFQLAGYRVTVDRVERRRVQRVVFERVRSGSENAA
jgi:CBS domain containing-hemolysin-like protein